MHLPPGLTHRPLTMDDASAVHAVMAADHQDQLGRVYIDLAEIIADWQRPSFDVEASTVGVFDGEQLVAYAEVSRVGRGDACVAPEHRDRGLWEPLTRWMQDKARAGGSTVVGMPVPSGGTTDQALAALGYRVRWTSWILSLPAGAEIPQRPLPEGYAVREAGAHELPAVHDVAEDAFLEWAQREREPLADFEASTTGRPGFEPWMLRVVTDGSGAIVAVACLTVTEAKEAYVERLATRADQRNKGLAQALLADSFRVAREHGAQECGLSTDSRTGALSLYQKVGMVVLDTWVNRAIDL